MGRGQLTRDKVLRAAVELLDEQGLDALSMRRLGERLGVEAMSLYRYVKDKQGLLNGVHEAILGEVRRPAARGAWQTRLRKVAQSFRAVLEAHPNAIPLFATRPAVTPGSLRLVEDCLAALEEAGFGPAERLNAFHSLTGFVVGLSLFQLGFEDQAYGEVSVDPSEFPLMGESLAESTWDLEREFRFGLDALLAGLEASLQGSTRKRR